MSKQSEAKEKQGYVAKAIPMVCMNCKHFKFDHVQTIKPSDRLPDGWWEDKNLRCGKGGFAVKKMGTCNEFDLQAQP